MLSTPGIRPGEDAIAQLAVQRGDSRPHFDLTGQETYLGRDLDNDIQLHDPFASGHHARIVRTPSGWKVEDLNSSNGTFVNGQRIEKSDIADGDTIRFGNTATEFSTGQGQQLDEDDSPSRLDWDQAQSMAVDQRNLDQIDAAATFATGSIRDSLENLGRLGSNELRATVLAETKLKLLELVSERLVQVLDPHQLVWQIMGILAENLDADRGIIGLFDENREIKLAATHGYPPGEEVQLSRTVLARVTRDRTGLLYDGSGDNTRTDTSVARMKIRSIICAPLWIGNDVIGVVSLESRRISRIFKKSDLEVLISAAHHVAIGIERARMMKNIVQERRMRTHLSKYLDGKVVDAMLAEEGGELLAPREQQVTIMFADIVSFSKMSEGMKPSELAQFMGAFLTKMTEVVFHHGGMVDKYLGDAIMALFALPVADERSAMRAVSAAVAMREAAQTIPLPTSAGEGSNACVRLRIGINTGVCVVGNIGSHQRLEYTAMGDAVNVASRLETFARPNEICVDEETASRVRLAFEMEEIGAIDVRNRVKPVNIYRILQPLDVRSTRVGSITEELAIHQGK